MEIFLRGTRMFVYLVIVDRFDPARDFAPTMSIPFRQIWNARMATLEERAPEANQDQWWTPMERVFELAQNP
jgi:L-rhamnose mutarotase